MADSIAALQAVEDWWLTQADKSNGAPACIFMVREALTAHRRATMKHPDDPLHIPLGPVWFWQVSYDGGESWVDWPRKPDPERDAGLAMAKVRYVSGVDVPGEGKS